MHEKHQPLRVVIAGGGTGGHISPAVAVATELRRQHQVELHWIGSHTGFERDAAERHDIPFHPIRTGKLRRYLALETVADSFRVPAGVLDARTALKRIKPDVIFSTGGFVSTPSVVAGRTLGIPSLTHEQTASIGLATKINARFCDIVALSFPIHATLRARRNTHVIVTGNPVRPSILEGNREALQTLFDVPADAPLLYVTGGAQGAHALNVAISNALTELVQHVAIIHQCGPQSGNGDFQRLLAKRDELPADLQHCYIPVERVGDELAHIYAAASLVFSRAGAGTVAEVSAVGLPSILVPLPGADEQRRNAMVLVEAGGAIMIDQDDLTPDRLIAEVRGVLTDDGRLAAMRDGAQSVTSDNPAGKIVDALVDLAGRS